MSPGRAHALCKFHAGTPVFRRVAGKKPKSGCLFFFRHRDHDQGDFFWSKFFYHRMCPQCHSGAHYDSDLHDTPCRSRSPKSAKISPSVEQKYLKFSQAIFDPKDNLEVFAYCRFIQTIKNPRGVFFIFLKFFFIKRYIKKNFSKYHKKFLGQKLKILSDQFFLNSIVFPMVKTACLYLFPSWRYFAKTMTHFQ